MRHLDLLAISSLFFSPLERLVFFLWIVNLIERLFFGLTLRLSPTISKRHIMSVSP